MLFHMDWQNIIAFADKNIPYRFKISTSRGENSDECKINVDELDEQDKKIDGFDFVYDVKQDMPEADYKLHSKPIQVLLQQMLDINGNPKTW